MSNIFAQAQALAFGKTARELLDEGVSPALVPHKVMPGNRPSTTVLGTKLTPYMLGVLIAMYEHSVFVQGAVWNINSFDQWGVELGKVMAQAITPELSKDAALSTERDSSTNALIRQYRSLKS
jgi:glucose-6-phosphate isomerase